MCFWYGLKDIDVSSVFCILLIIHLASEVNQHLIPNVKGRWDSQFHLIVISDDSRTSNFYYAIDTLMPIIATTSPIWFEQNFFVSRRLIDLCCCKRLETNFATTQTRMNNTTATKRTRHNDYTLSVGTVNSEIEFESMVSS